VAHLFGIETDWFPRAPPVAVDRIAEMPGPANRNILVVTILRNRGKGKNRWEI